MAIQKLVIEADDTVATEHFLTSLGVEAHVAVRAAAAPSAGFRGFTLSLICTQPADVDAVLHSAVGAGATVLKPATKSFWGYGGVVQAPDGTIWKVASSSKKNKGPARAEFEDLVLLLGVEDVKASKQFYVDQGLTVAKSYGGKYVELVSAPVKLALYPRKANAKDAGVDPAGSGGHRLVVTTAVGSFADPDGYVWEQQ